MEVMKPKVFISRCIEQEACRWNGSIISSAEIRDLIPFVEVINACPEADIGLGIPRDPIRIEMHEEKICLVQPSTGIELTDKMKVYAEEQSHLYQDVDGFIFKSKSPSCGTSDVKIYSGPNSKEKSSYGSGLFYSEIKSTFSKKAIEDEGRLTNHKIRDHFLTRIYVSARFRAIKADLQMRDLVDFHSRHKYLYLAYNQAQMRVLGKIVGNLEKKSNEEVFNLYEIGLSHVFLKLPKYSNIVNVWMHIMGYFSDQLSTQEKKHLLLKMDHYNEDRIPASVVTELLYSLAIRFNQEYIINQYFFYPYPLELMSIHDSGKRRI